MSCIAHVAIFKCRDYQHFLVDLGMYLAPNASLWSAMLECVPLAFTLRFDAHTRVISSSTKQSKPINPNELCTKPVFCRNGISNNTFSMRRAWIAASLKFCRLPRLSRRGGTRASSVSIQFDSGPRRVNLFLKSDPFVVWYVAAAQRLEASSYHAGFARPIPQAICSQSHSQHIVALGRLQTRPATIETNIKSTPYMFIGYVRLLIAQLSPCNKT